MIGVEFVADRETKEPAGGLADALIAACLERGLVLLTCGAAHNVVRWIPPLNVTSAEIGRAVGIFDEALKATA
jgi:4-aminobutyrate aminotransferase-like enzyme